MGNPFIKAAQTAIKAAGSVGSAQSVTLRRSSSAYVPSTGVNTQTVTDYSWTAVVEHYAEGLVDGSSVKRGDRRLLGAAADLSVTPDAETDTIVMDSLVYELVADGISTDPATATWTVQVRR